jgi:hypothetical protein
MIEQAPCPRPRRDRRQQAQPATKPPEPAGSTLGHELDVVLTAKLWGPLWLQPGYGYFLPESAGTRLAGSRTQHFVFSRVIIQPPGKLDTAKVAS